MKNVLKFASGKKLFWKRLDVSVMELANRIKSYTLLEEAIFLACEALYFSFEFLKKLNAFDAQSIGFIVRHNSKGYSDQMQ